MECGDGKNGVRREHDRVEVGMIDQHLARVGPRSLCIRFGEVGREIVQGRSGPTDQLVTKSAEHFSACFLGPSRVVVQENKGDFVPVLRLAT